MLTYLKTSWHIVLAAIVLAVLIFIAAFYLGGKLSTLQENIIEQPTSVSETEESVTSDAVVEAYFVGTHEEVSLPDGTACHALVVREGTDTIIAYYKRLIEAGNSVQSLTSNGSLRINLPWKDMPEYAKQKLLSEKEVSVSLIKRSESGKGVGSCYSFFAFDGIN